MAAKLRKLILGAVIGGVCFIAGAFWVCGPYPHGDMRE